MNKTLKILIVLTLINLGCVASKTQHYNMNSVQEFLSRPDRIITHTNHANWDRDILRRLNDRELILNRE